MDILDSGATSHLLVIAALTSDHQEAKNPLSVKLPDGARVNSTHTYTLAIPYLHAKARIAHIIPGLASHSLLSIVQLCNAGCEVRIKNISCTVRYRGRLILQGQKCSRTRLWMVPLDTRPITLNKGPSITPPTQPSRTAQPMRDHLKRATGAQEIAANTIPPWCLLELYWLLSIWHRWLVRGGHSLAVLSLMVVSAVLY